MARYGDAWEELGYIDYLLDDLARAVERGEIPRKSYDAIAPRHLARRAQLVAEIDRTRAGWQAPARAAANTPQPGQTLEASGPPARTVSGAPAAVPREVQPASAAVQPAPVWAQPAPREVRWTQVLAYTGAFLVVVAAAIFTVAVWETVSTTAKLGFLGVFTVGFYAAGVWAWRAGMHGGGVALAAVGAAMLLFDGWIAIDGYGLAGPWPWAVLLLVLSAVYWVTEVWMSGRFFGATGAAAQVGWWWLLGQGMGWTVAPRLAGIAAVAVVWAFAAERVRGREGYDSLTSVLRIAAPVVVAGAAVGLLADIPVGPPRWVDVISAAVVALAATAVTDRKAAHWRAAAALGALPLLIAIAAMTAFDGASWGHVAALVGISGVAAAYGLYRDAPGHVGVALVAELGAWLAVAEIMDLSARVTLALLAAVALSWLLAERLLLSADARDALPSSDRTALVAAVGGWLLLLGVTATAFFGSSVVPIDGSIPGHDALLALWLLGVWFAAGALVRMPPVGIAVLLVSVWAAVVSSMAWSGYPQWHAWPHPLAALLVAAVWSFVPRLPRMVASEEIAPAVVRVIALGLSVWTAGLAIYHFPGGSWGVVGVLGVLAAFWIADAVRSRSVMPLAAVGPTLVAAGCAAGITAAQGAQAQVVDAGVVAGVVAGALWATLTNAARTRVERVGEWSAVPAALAATALTLTFVARPLPLAASFAFVAFAWAACVASARVSWLALPAALAAAASAMTLLAYAEVQPEVTVATLTLVSALTFLPTLRSRTGIAPPLAVAAVVVASAHAALGIDSLIGFTSPGSWTDLGFWGTAAAMLWLGVSLVAVSVAYRIEIAEYLGAAAVLFAAWLVFAAVDVTPIAPYAALAGVCLAVVAARWSSRDEGRLPSSQVDWLAVTVFVGIPVVAAVGSRLEADVWVNALWAVGLALAAMTAGVLFRVRAYLFGGVAGIIAVSVWRSFFVLVEFWWVVVGLIGIAMLVIALTWEHHQMLLKRTGSRLQEMLVTWR